MNNLQFKQHKAAWRLVLRFCPIETASAVFQTCQENRELFNEEALWEFLHSRDFGIKGSKSNYIFRYSFGFTFLYKAQNCTVSTSSEGMKKVRYLFIERGNYFITFGRGFESIDRYHLRISSMADCTTFDDVRGLYELHPLKRNIERIKGKNRHELNRINLIPLIRWIMKRFDVSDFLISVNSIKFYGSPHNGYEILNGMGISNETCYIAHFDGKFTGSSGYGVYSRKDGICEKLLRIK